MAVIALSIFVHISGSTDPILETSSLSINGKFFSSRKTSVTPISIKGEDARREPRHGRLRPYMCQWVNFKCLSRKLTTHVVKLAFNATRNSRKKPKNA